MPLLARQRESTKYVKARSIIGRFAGLFQLGQRFSASLRYFRVASRPARAEAASLKARKAILTCLDIQMRASRRDIDARLHFHYGWLS